MSKLKVFILCAAVLASGCSKYNNSGKTNANTFKAWTAPIEVRVYPGAFTREPGKRNVRLVGLSGEVLSAQVVVKSVSDIKGLAARVTGLEGPAGGGHIPESSIRVRYGGYIRVDETMSMVSDPLLELESVDVPANMARAVWLTVKVPPDAEAGLYKGLLELSSLSGGGASFEVSVEVLPARLKAPVDWRFYLNIWQDPTPVARAHRVEVWSPEHWRILERYAKNYAAHGMKAIMTHIVYDPWQSVRGYATDAMVEWKYPGAFIPGEAEKFTWDFTNFDRYVELMMEAGVREKIDCYSLVMGPGSTTEANIRYLDTSGSGEYRTVDLRVGGPAWREIWAAFLPVLQRHLKEKGWFEEARLGFDEKPEEVMRVIYDFMIETAPDFKLASSGGYPGDKRKMADEVVLIVDDLLDEHKRLRSEPLIKLMRENRNSYITFYTCCWPLHPNTFLFSPLRESRMMAWLAWKYGLDGYSRWAVDLFPEDIWNQPRFTWPSGDMFFVYPGKEGPLDSMRWELLRQGIQDYEALCMALEAAGRAGREDLVEKLRSAVDRATVIESCSWIPYIEESRAVVNEVIRHLAGDS